ncbi:hypothetical protein DFP72DRAFT_1079682 [Ephemerocybe angulata]|uniref:Uncharacterized protein n=1 Tax=Ephemerocybe angulata TaxID=980116 RepID=A0A8H6HCL4_9AGAR|nr:hypothetical protein DFP72DRAFT_1079682 [Tulosesus angulatus]
MSSRSKRQPSTTPSQSDALQHNFLALSPTGYPSNNLNTQSFYPPTAPHSGQPSYTAHQAPIQPSAYHVPQGHNSTGRAQLSDIPGYVGGGSVFHPQFPSQPEPGSSFRPPAQDAERLPLDQLLAQAPQTIRDLVAASTGIRDFTTKPYGSWRTKSDKEEGYYTVFYTPPGAYSFRVRRDDATREEVKKSWRNGE